MATFHPDPGTQRNRRQGIGVLVFIGLALVMTYLPSDRQQEVAGVLRSTVLRPFIATQELVARARVQTRDVTALRSRMDSLVSVLTNQTTLAEENRRLRELLDLERRIGVDYRPASLLRPGTEGSESMFLVDLNGADSVRSGAPVIAPEGLVGVVREVGPGGAIGMDWTHPDFRASAMTADGTTFGIVEPTQGEFPRDDRLILTGTPFTTQLEAGTWIVTSGRGGVYPRGIPIGTIEGLDESEGGWRKSYSVEPAVQLGAVTHVLVGVGESALPVPPPMDPADSSGAAVAGGAPGAAAPPASAPDASAGPSGREETVRDLGPIMLPPDSSPGEAEPEEGNGAPAPEPSSEAPPSQAGVPPTDEAPSDVEAPDSAGGDPGQAGADASAPPDSVATPDPGFPSAPTDSPETDALPEVDAAPEVDSAAGPDPGSSPVDTTEDGGTPVFGPELPAPPVADGANDGGTTTPDTATTTPDTATTSPPRDSSDASPGVR